VWKKYVVELQFTGPFAASTPKDPQEIEAMLEHRTPSDAECMRRVRAGEVLKTLSDLAEEVAEEVEAEEGEKGWATFKKDEGGLYYEGRCVRAHLKDCANVLQKTLQIKALKSKVANRVYVFPERLYLDKMEPDGRELRMVHAMTPKGPRSSLKFVDYVMQPRMKFFLKVLDDGEIKADVLRALFEYGGVHGMGQERSQQWGQYEVVNFGEVDGK